MSVCLLSVHPSMSVCLSIRLFVCLSVCSSVCLSVHLSVCLSIVCSSVHLSVCLLFVCLLSVHPSVCLPVHSSICLSVCLSVCPYACLSVCSSVCLSIFCPSIHPSVYLCVYYLSIHPSICLSVCPSVCLSVHPSICLSVHWLTDLGSFLHQNCYDVLCNTATCMCCKMYCITTSIISSIRITNKPNTFPTQDTHDNILNTILRLLSNEVSDHVRWLVIFQHGNLHCKLNKQTD